MRDRPARRPISARGAVLDANVLVPNALRDTLLRAAEAGLYDARWSATTLLGVERALLSRILPEHPTRAERVRRLLAAIRGAFPAAAVVEDRQLLARLTNDPKDRHVLAAAIQGGKATIVTYNLRDFPTSALAPYNITAQSPDQFLQDLFGRDPATLLDLLIAQGTALHDQRTLDGLLDTLAHAGRHEAVRMRAGSPARAQRLYSAACA